LGWHTDSENWYGFCLPFFYRFQIFPLLLFSPGLFFFLAILDFISRNLVCTFFFSFSLCITYFTYFYFLIIIVWRGAFLEAQNRTQDALRQKAVGFKCLNYGEPASPALGLRAMPDDQSKCRGLRFCFPAAGMASVLIHRITRTICDTPH